ncbi:MAG: hypothetical protein KTR28_05910 [Micavibrio sp.]|nr:hypothetical protein [Micavibrio sp.]
MLHKTSQFLEKKSNLLGSIASLIGIIAALVGCIFYASNHYRQHIIKRDALFTGIWTNPSEGCINCELHNDPNRPIILSLKAENGILVGTLDASEWLAKDNYNQLKQDERIYQLAQRTIHGFLNVQGRLSGNKGEIVVWDFIDGKENLYAHANLNLIDGVLYMETIGDHFLAIPDKSELFKTINEDGKSCDKVVRNSPLICFEDRYQSSPKNDYDKLMSDSWPK